jgi:hypothetical protein
MPRIRTLKPEVHQHRKVGPLSDRQFRVWVGLITQADDEGRFVADPEALRATFFAYHPKVRAREIQAALEHLAATGLIRLYEAAGVPYGFFPSWADHQRIHKHHFTASRLPAPGGSGTAPVPVPPARGTSPVGSDLDRIGSGSGTDRRGRESEGRGDASPLTPPLVAIAKEPPSQSNNQPPLRRPVRGEFADVIERLRRAHPDWAEAEVQEKATHEYVASLR